MPENETYRKHLQSEYWRNLKAQVVAERGSRCERCGRTLGLEAELHHLHYMTLGQERLCDVELVCRTCHANGHGQGMPKVEPVRDDARSPCLLPEHLRAKRDRLLGLLPHEDPHEADQALAEYLEAVRDHLRPRSRPDES